MVSLMAALVPVRRNRVLLRAVILDKRWVSYFITGLI